MIFDLESISPSKRINFDFFGTEVDGHNIIGFYLVALWLVGLVVITVLVNGENSAKVELQESDRNFSAKAYCALGEQVLSRKSLENGTHYLQLILFHTHLIKVTNSIRKQVPGQDLLVCLMSSHK